MKIKTTVLFLLLSVSAWAIEPANRFHCQNSDAKVDVDIYATGHPMSGIGMYTGLMQLEIPQFGLNEIVHFEANVSERKEDAYKITGDSEGPHRNRYTLYFRDLPSSEKLTFADLMTEDMGPFPGSKEMINGLECKAEK